MALLIVNPDSADAYNFQLRQGFTSVGRDPSNDLSLDDPSVSGCHCELIITGGSVVIRDLNSTNGIFIDGRRSAGSLLANGQTINVGSVQMTISLSSDEQNTAYIASI